MPDCTMLKPGDRAMLVDLRPRWNGAIAIQEARVLSVWKNGLIGLEDGDGKYRAKDGRRAGARSPVWHYAYTLSPWDDDLWQRYNIDRQKRDMCNQLHELGKVFQALSLDVDGGASVWEKLPDDVRALVAFPT
jgi:hypothetical protein